MTSAELSIMAFFRRYQVGPDEMLFFNPGECKLASREFRDAMRSLMNKGLVVSERPMLAYSLTPAGYKMSLEIDA